MHFLDLIEAKKNGRTIDAERWRAAIGLIVAGEVPDYQVAALLMAIRWQGLTPDEATDLTEVMADSGERWSFPAAGGPLVDKHSTGGVGDKVSLVLAPLAAACGCRVPMVSGRGLGHSGGTLDKLEAIPGFRTHLTRDEFAGLLDTIGVAMGAQTHTLVPADRILYALRDATATIDEPGLITASILSKKIAEGTSGLVLDVKVGRGSFLGDHEPTRALAVRLIAAARGAGLATTALLTDMDRPLGLAVGNALEVAEAIACLRGTGPAALRELSLELTAEMLLLGDLEPDIEAARAHARRCLDNGSALRRFEQLVEAQGGEPAVASDPSLLPQASDTRALKARSSGYVVDLDPLSIGRAAVALRAGRHHRDDTIDPGAGIVLEVGVGDAITAGAAWATMHFGAGARIDAATDLLNASIRIGDEPPPTRPLIIERHA